MPRSTVRDPRPKRLELARQPAHPGLGAAALLIPSHDLERRGGKRIPRRIAVRGDERPVHAVEAAARHELEQQRAGEAGLNATAPVRGVRTLLVVERDQQEFLGQGHALHIPVRAPASAREE